MEHDPKARLVRHGLAVFMLGLLTGFAVQAFANPRSGLAAHLEGVMNGTFLIALGVAWSQVHLSPRLEKVAVSLAVYGAYANWVGTMLAAIFGASETTPIAGAGHHAAIGVEKLVTAILVSVGLSMVGAVALALWGARRTHARTQPSA